MLSLRDSLVKHPRFKDLEAYIIICASHHRGDQNRDFLGFRKGEELRYLTFTDPKFSYSNWKFIPELQEQIKQDINFQSFDSVLNQ